MRFLHSAVLLASLAAANNLDVADSKVSYDGYKLFRVATHNEPEKVKAGVVDVKSAVAMNVDVNKFLDIAVAREDVEQFKATVAGLDVTVINEDIGKDIQLEMDMAAYSGKIYFILNLYFRCGGGRGPVSWFSLQWGEMYTYLYTCGSFPQSFAVLQCRKGTRLSANTNPIGANANAVPDPSWFNSYHPYVDHVQFFQDLQAALPANSELFNVARSYEGRTIFAIHLWGSGGKGSKPRRLFSRHSARQGVDFAHGMYLTGLVNWKFV